MSTQDLYGMVSKDLEAARQEVERALGLELEPHESSYHCGDYYYKRLPNGDEFTLQYNYDDVACEWAEDDYIGYGTLFHVYSPARGDEFRELLKRNAPSVIALERSATAADNVLRRMKYVDGKEVVYFEKQLKAR